jgi:TPR repeat protein
MRNQVARFRSDPASADCGNLGRVVRDASAGEAATALAARLFEQSCKHGHGFACADLAGLELAASHAPRATELLDQACAAERSGTGAEGELCALAGALAACPRKDAAACGALGSAFQRQGQLGGNVELERRYHDRGCQLGSGQSCLALGSSYFDVESEQKRVSKLMDRACELGVAEGCTQIGYRYIAATGVAQDVPRGLRALERGCMLGSAGACRRSGAYYAYGEARDAARSLALARQGCELDDGWSCDHVGFAYEYGEEAPLDKAKAREFYARACDLGERIACSKAKPRRGLISQWIESRWK